MNVLSLLRRALLPATVAGALAVGLCASEGTASAHERWVGRGPVHRGYGAPVVSHPYGWGYGGAYAPRVWRHPWRGRPVGHWR